MIVVWLVVGAVFFTFYFRFINVRAFGHALRLVRGDYADPDDPGEVSHFQALTTAVSGTVGVGNIAHVAIAISIGGPGALFWLVVAGLLGMSSKFVECTLGVKYRTVNPDGSVSGGPMFCLDKGLSDLGLPRLGRGLAIYYAICIIVGGLGIGCMFQSNQAYVQFVNVTGGEHSFLANRGWLFGLVLAAVVGSVILGGIRSIARVTSKLVPFMALLYISTALIVILANVTKLPGAIVAIVTGAFSPEGVAGGAVAVLILGFRRAAFSNEAGIGSAAIAHSAVQTDEPVTEGFVSLLEPFIDTVVICTMTALVIITTVYDPAMASAGISGIELTTSAFASTLSWSPLPLSIAAVLFAFSTIISWSYYGLKAFKYLAGQHWLVDTGFKLFYCSFIVLGSSVQLGALIDLSDALVFLVAIPNILGLYLLAPVVRREMLSYRERLKRGEFPSAF